MAPSIRGRELFGDNTLLPNGSLAANGFAAIAQYDLDGNGKIDSADAAYSQLRVWQDSNQDGISQAGELHTLAAEARRVDVDHADQVAARRHDRERAQRGLAVGR